MSERITGRNAREIADKSNAYCVSASLIEAADALGISVTGLSVQELSRQIGESQVGHTPVIDIFSAIQTGSDVLGMDVETIFANPSFLPNKKIPDNVTARVKPVTGIHPVNIPNLRIMAKKTDQNKWATHAETEDGTDNKQARLDELIKDGWSTAAAVSLKKK